MIPLNNILRHLDALVRFDTQNPPREIEGSGILAQIRVLMGSRYDYRVEDLGEGCLNMLVSRGQPKVLFNVHLDTVPAATGWTSDPFELQVTTDRAIGLGACDIKGAAACLIAAANAVKPEDLAILFSTDEEAGSSRCVRHFLDQEPDFDLVVVGEPTKGRAVVEHRGIATGRTIFHGVSGHASSGLAERDSALHHAVRWADAAMKFAGRQERARYGDLSGIRFNLGHMEGGIKPNMIADRAEIWWGFRPLPDQPADKIVGGLEGLVAPGVEAEFVTGFRAPALPAARRGVSIADRAKQARQKAEARGLRIGDAVDFWTEAALFSAAGLDTIVFGPGDIAQAHTAGEWVALSQLLAVADAYAAMMG